MSRLASLRRQRPYSRNYSGVSFGPTWRVTHISPQSTLSWRTPCSLMTERVENNVIVSGYSFTSQNNAFRSLHTQNKRVSSRASSYLDTMKTKETFIKEYNTSRRKMLHQNLGDLISVYQTILTKNNKNCMTDEFWQRSLLPDIRALVFSALLHSSYEESLKLLGKEHEFTLAMQGGTHGTPKSRVIQPNEIAKLAQSLCQMNEMDEMLWNAISQTVVQYSILPPDKDANEEMLLDGPQVRQEWKKPGILQKLCVSFAEANKSTLHPDLVATLEAILLNLLDRIDLTSLIRSLWGLQTMHSNNQEMFQEAHIRLLTLLSSDAKNRLVSKDMSLLREYIRNCQDKSFVSKISAKLDDDTAPLSDSLNKQNSGQTSVAGSGSTIQTYQLRNGTMAISAMCQSKSAPISSRTIEQSSSTSNTFSEFRLPYVPNPSKFGEVSFKYRTPSVLRDIYVNNRENIRDVELARPARALVGSISQLPRHSNAKPEWKAAENLLCLLTEDVTSLLREKDSRQLSVAESIMLMIVFGEGAMRFEAAKHKQVVQHELMPTIALILINLPEQLRKANKAEFTLPLGYILALSGRLPEIVQLMSSSQRVLQKRRNSKKATSNLVDILQTANKTLPELAKALHSQLELHMSNENVIIDANISQWIRALHGIRKYWTIPSTNAQTDKDQTILRNLLKHVVTSSNVPLTIHDSVHLLRLIQQEPESPEYTQNVKNLATMMQERLYSKLHSVSLQQIGLLLDSIVKCIDHKSIDTDIKSSIDPFIDTLFQEIFKRTNSDKEIFTKYDLLGLELILRTLTNYAPNLVSPQVAQHSDEMTNVALQSIRACQQSLAPFLSGHAHRARDMRTYQDVLRCMHSLLQSIASLKHQHSLEIDHVLNDELSRLASTWFTFISGADTTSIDTAHATRGLPFTLSNSEWQGIAAFAQASRELEFAVSDEFAKFVYAESYVLLSDAAHVLGSTLSASQRSELVHGLHYQVNALSDPNNTNYDTVKDLVVSAQQRMNQLL